MLDNSTAPKLAYGIADFARAVGVSRDKVYSEIRDGRLQAHKIGSRSVITADAARQYLASLPRSKAPPENENPPAVQSADGPECRCSNPLTKKDQNHG